MLALFEKSTNKLTTASFMDHPGQNEFTDQQKETISSWHFLDMPSTIAECHILDLKIAREIWNHYMSSAEITLTLDDNGEFVSATYGEPIVLLDTIKENKIKELTVARDEQLYAGFSSDATGTTLYFGFDSIDQAYLQEKALLMTLDSTVTTVDWKTKDGMYTFTRDQFFQVVKDGGKHKEDIVRELMQLQAMVMNASTKEAVEAIVW